jgi:hypothetical protein
MEAKRFADHACGEHGGIPVLVSAQIETRTPEVKLDEDFLINDSWDHIVYNFFEPDNEDTFYMELIDWLFDDSVDWEPIARSWLNAQFPKVKASDHRWNQILPAMAKVLRNITLVTALKEYAQTAHREAVETGNDDWYLDDPYYEIDSAIDEYKENIEFVTEKFNELADAPDLDFMHNIRILKPVGYRGANRILAVASWRNFTYYGNNEDYNQVGEIHYARSEQDAKFLLGAAKLPAVYSKWTWRDKVLYDNPKPKEKAACVVAGAVYRQAETPVVGEVFAGDQHLGFLVAKNKKLLDAEAQRIYDWSRDDHETYYPNEPFGELRVEHSFVGAPGVEGIIEEWYRYGEMEQTMESALAEYEEKGVLQA